MSMPSSQAEKPARRLPWLKLGLLALACAAGAWLVLRGVDPRPWIERGLGLIRGLGPAPFFAAMTVLPAFGCPLTAFTLTAGPVFARELGMPAVVALSLASIAANLALSYWVSRYALRPTIGRLLRWLGYNPPPRVTPENRLGVLVLVRVAPGPPYALQNFVLGIVEVPFRLYMGVSWVIVSAYSTAFILFGDALVHGRGEMAVWAIGLLAACMVGVNLLRKYYQRRQAQAGLAEQAGQP